MRKSARVSISTALFIMMMLSSSTLISQSKDYDILVGTWDVVVALEANDSYSTFDFSVKKDSLICVWSSEMGDLSVKKLKFVKNKLSFESSIDMGGEMLYLSVSGEAEENKITGKISTDFGELPLTAKKRKKK
jgi:hypothetical protein